MSDKKKGVSRRQFLSYALMGTGGFLVSGMMVPMLRFAIDPILKPKVAGKESLVKVGKLDEFSAEPKMVKFKLHRIDGWHEEDATLSAFISKDDKGEVLALSPICKHLGCTVAFGTDKKHPEQYFCPCHGGRYTKDGINIPGTPPPSALDEFHVQVKDGEVYLGDIIKR